MPPLLSRPEEQRSLALVQLFRDLVQRPEVLYQLIQRVLQLSVDNRALLSRADVLSQQH